MIRSWRSSRRDARDAFAARRQDERDARVRRCDVAVERRAVYGPDPLETLLIESRDTALIVVGSRDRDRFADLGPELSTVDVAGSRLYVRTVDVDELIATRRRNVVRLLPGFDQYVLGPGTGDPQIVAEDRRAEYPSSLARK